MKTDPIIRIADNTIVVNDINRTDGVLSAVSTVRENRDLSFEQPPTPSTSCLGDFTGKRFPLLRGGKITAPMEKAESNKLARARASPAFHDARSRARKPRSSWTSTAREATPWTDGESLAGTGEPHHRFVIVDPVKSPATKGHKV